MHYPAENLSLEHRLIGEIVKEYPETSEIMERYFGGHCLKKPGFKIQTLGMACILFGINQKELLQEFDKTQH
jgi:Domain of unknown function (DUF1858)